jgi:hypothetical protein
MISPYSQLLSSDESNNTIDDIVQKLLQFKKLMNQLFNYSIRFGMRAAPAMNVPCLGSDGCPLTHACQANLIQYFRLTLTSQLPGSQQDKKRSQEQIKMSLLELTSRFLASPRYCSGRPVPFS